MLSSNYFQENSTTTPKTASTPHNHFYLEKDLRKKNEECSQMEKTIQEATELVIQASSMMSKGADIFILDI